MPRIESGIVVKRTAPGSKKGSVALAIDQREASRSLDVDESMRHRSVPRVIHSTTPEGKMHIRLQKEVVMTEKEEFDLKKNQREILHIKNMEK